MIHPLEAGRLRLAVLVLVRPLWKSALGIAAAVGAVLFWFHSQEPRNDRDWQVDVSRPPRIERSGDRVVVKVQRPNARDEIERDLGLLELFGEKAAARAGLREVIDLPALVEHLSASLRRELDFREEASNIELMREVRRHADVPLVPMTYFNVVNRAGLEKFASMLHGASAEGLILPDLPFEEGRELAGHLAKRGIA